MEKFNQITKSESLQKLKVLWWSNGVHVGTGYGVQTNNIVFRLHKAGIDIRVASNYGQQGSALDYNGVKQYGQSCFTQFGEDDLKSIIDNWKPNVFVTLFDVWVGAFSNVLGEDWLSKLHSRWFAWIPVDSEPVAEAVAKQAGKAFKAIAMSKFGQAELKKAGVAADYIPHGIETGVFKPAVDKRECKVWLEQHSMPINAANPAHITPDDFVVGVNKANKDRERADFDRMLQAFKIFLDNNPDSRKRIKLYLHTWVDFPAGTPIKALCKEYGIEQNVKFTHDYYMRCGLTSNDLAKQYNGFDVLMNLARGEGFGVPILEAESCGVPVVATDYTSMTELVQGHGWLVPYVAKLRNGLNSYWAVPDEAKAADALNEAFACPKDTARNGKLSREFACSYDFDTAIVPLWRDLLGEVESELSMFGSAQSKDAAFDALYK